MATLNRYFSAGWMPFACFLAVTGLLQACAPVPVEPVDPAEPALSAVAEVQSQDPVPELNLNLPKRQSCQCQSEGSRDQTFLERGYTTLAQGDYIEAVQYFQRHQRLESSPEADWEAGVAIAYVSMLPNSPFYDPEAARKSLRTLNKQLTGDMQVHEESLLMRESLEALVALDRHNADLEASNATLKEDLKKREEAIKRLRELTLGQRGGRQ